ncbi:hypothetical protein NQ317_019384 [Molorchus minor]|uniref:Cytochrome P450 n=1 Tax=Molorchus minor TaxID=1323400 RepID=A0ABQ9JEW2_9CUCU|nr:hypothetical protein NQ317_019384 [Molorchus minor]
MMAQNNFQYVLSYVGTPSIIIIMFLVILKYYNNNSLYYNNLFRMYTVVHARMVKVWLQVEWIFKLTKYWKLQEEGKSVIHGFFRNVIAKVKESHVCLKKTDSSFRTLLEQMLDIRDELPDFATDEELVHHLSTLYSASEDTVTTIVSFSLVLLGMYPTIQNKVVDEILNIVGMRDIEEADLGRLEYLDMVIKDVLRLFPIAPFIAREATQDFQLDTWMIPKGCTVIMSIHSIHRDNKLWEKPNEFYPEHFLPGAVRGRHPYAFLPFSAGPRGCLGKPYAYMAMKIMLVTILQHYIIEADGKLEDKKLKTDISVRFKDEIYPIRIKKRL